MANILREIITDSNLLFGIFGIHRGYYMATRRYKISLRVLQKYFSSEHSEQGKYFSTLGEKFRIPKRPCNVLFILYILMKFPHKTPERKARL